MVKPQSMYKTPEPRKNAAKPTDGNIIKRKKVVINFLQRTEIIKKLKAGYQSKNLAFEYDVGLTNEALRAIGCFTRWVEQH